MYLDNVERMVASCTITKANRKKCQACRCGLILESMDQYVVVRFAKCRRMGMTHTGLDRLSSSGLMPSQSTNSGTSTLLSSDSIISSSVPSADINPRPYVIPVESLLSNQYQEPCLYQETYTVYPEQSSNCNFNFDLEDYMQEDCRSGGGFSVRGEPEKALPSLRWHQHQEERRWENVRWEEQEESRRFQLEEVSGWAELEDEGRNWVQEVSKWRQVDEGFLPQQESRWSRQEEETRPWTQDDHPWQQEEESVTWKHPGENYLLSCDPGQCPPSEEPLNDGEVTTSIPLVEQVQSADLASCLSWQEVVGYSRETGPQWSSSLSEAGEIAARSVLMEEQIEEAMGRLVRRILEEKLWRWLHALPCLYHLSRADLEAAWVRRREALLLASLGLALGSGLSSLQDQLDTLGLFLPADTAAFSLSPAVGLALVQEALPYVLPHQGSQSLPQLGGLPTDRASACLLLLLIFTQQVTHSGKRCFRTSQVSQPTFF